MSKYPFLQVDAFTDHALGGNPCAIVLDADDLEAATMQAIALEMNLSETSFVMRSSIADFRARYFTPAAEIPMAGHPTIATSLALVDTGRLKLTGDHISYQLELNVGPIRVDIESMNGIVHNIIMSQKKPQFLKKYNATDVMPLFGLTAEDGLQGAVIQTVSTGTPQLMVPLRNQEALRRAQLQVDSFRTFHAAADFFSPHLFCLTGFTSAGNTSARHFGVPPDTFEDPFTGSATGNMGAYLWHYGLLEKPVFVAEQGHWMKRPGQASVEVVGPRENIETVRVGGPAVVVLRGELIL
jgi:trans-2,3-dihydro-3-hydroxyanthranilate isomerase